MRTSIFEPLYFAKFIYSVKATKFCDIFTLLLTVCTVVKSKVKISQNFVAFLEYMNFNNGPNFCHIGIPPFKKQQILLYNLLLLGKNLPSFVHPLGLILHNRSHANIFYGFEISACFSFKDRFVCF